MKKLLIVLTIIISTTTAQAYIRPIPAPRYIPVNTAYQRGYNQGYQQGRKDHRDKVVKAVGVSLLVVAGGILVYQLAKPSDNYAGQVQLARF